MKTAGKIALGVAGLAVVVGGVFLLSGDAKASGGSGGGGSGGGGSGGGGSGGGGGGTPGGSNKPKPKPKPGGGKPKPKPPAAPKTSGSGRLDGPQDLPAGSKYWGTPSGEYTFVGDLQLQNWIMIGKDCSWVAEGSMFRPNSTDVAVERGTLEETLMVGPPEAPLGFNTAWGFVDALENRGFDAKSTVEEIVVEVSPLCGAVGLEQWSSEGTSGGMYGWFEDFMYQIENWRQGIEFGGDE